MHGLFDAAMRSGCLLLCAVAVAAAADQVKVEGGVLEGIAGADPTVRVFEGVLRISGVRHRSEAYRQGS